MQFTSISRLFLVPIVGITLALGSCGGGDDKTTSTSNPTTGSSSGNTTTGGTPGNNSTPPASVNPPPADTTGALTLPDLLNYTFTSAESKILPGTSTENASGYNCSGTIKTEDQLGRLALISLFYQNGCYTDGRYNHNDYQVERGIVSDAQNKVRLEAYRIHEPSRKATNFLAAKHQVYYRFPTQEDYSVYLFDGNSINKLSQVTASQIDTSQFVKVENLTVSDLKGSATYLFVPSSQRVSVFTDLAAGIEGARVKSTNLTDVLKYRYGVDGTPFDTQLDFNSGPGDSQNVYSPAKQFVLVQNNTGQLGIVWQDRKDNISIKLTWLGNDLRSSNTLSLPNSRNEKLVTVTYDDNGIIYYLTIQPGNIDNATETDRTATLYKINVDGQQLMQRSLDTSVQQLNILSSDNKVASLCYLNGNLGLIVDRVMHKTADQLNHHGAIAVVFDANTLALSVNHEQTSGHSFEGSILTSSSSGQFVGVDVGDNYPRGVNLHKFDRMKRTSRVVHTFKTAHGSKPTSPAGQSYPVYSEISGGGTTYYQWSNDNRTYTELGGVIEAKNGYTVIFAGETTPDGRTLDNARVRDNLNDPRNIGLVQVISNFEHASGSGNEVTDDLVRTRGLTETSGFYTFGGSRSAQRNAGVVWLTHYQDKNQENVSRLKTVKLNDGNILLLWEKWTPDHYVNTYAMKVDEVGNPLTEVVEMGTQVRLNRRDDVWQIGNAVYLIAGDKNERKLELMVLKLK